MTLEQLLDQTPANPLDVNSPTLRWDKWTISDHNKAASGTLPYAVVDGLDENERETTHDAYGFWDQLVLIKLYQPSDEAGRTPHDSVMYALYHYLLTVAPLNVTAAGKHRPFIQLLRGANHTPPTRDEETLGLYARLNFRLRFVR